MCMAKTGSAEHRTGRNAALLQIIDIMADAPVSIISDG